MKIGEITISPSAAFKVLEFTPNSVIDPGSSIPFQIALNSESLLARTYEATVTITSTEDDITPITFPISATVVESLEGGPIITAVSREGEDLVLTILPGNGSYRVEHGSDLSGWSTLSGFTGLTDGTLRLPDAIEPSPSAQFYRLAAD